LPKLEIKEAYRAVFYSGDTKVSTSPVKLTYDEAYQDIEDANKLYEAYHYTPWTHAQVEKVYYRH
jgi:hypothetical protein